MRVMTDADGSEDVNDFLLRIRELGDQRDKEDEERTRKLEEEIIQGRKERQARRAGEIHRASPIEACQDVKVKWRANAMHPPERARSLSPTKDSSSNAGTPSSIRSNKEMPVQEQLSRTPSLQPTSPRALDTDDPLRKTNGTTSAPNFPGPVGRPRELPQPPSKPQTLASTPPSAAVPLARAGTLSWQQRPSSRGSTGPRTRPVSMLASEQIPSKPPRRGAEPATTKDDSLSRSEIAQSLGSRDPAWFKQTQERRSGSAAYRKNQVEDLSDTASTTSSMRLPGMSRESTAEPEGRMSPLPESIGSNGGPGVDHRYSDSASMTSGSGIRSPLPTMASQRFEPPSSDTISTSGDDTSSAARALAMSPAQGRIYPERMDRPTSPTKGLGGFVQSAMLKRSDSVSKRWSTQAGPGLSRGNSTASNLSGYGGSRYPLGGITPLTESRSNNISREGSPTSTSRPTSSHNDASTAQRLSENDRPGASAIATRNQAEADFDAKFAKPVLRESKSPTPQGEVMSPPASPSKRWSSTKSSWLENAINKPDSSKIKSPAPQQPAWMADINRAKQKRGSVDIGKESRFKEVTIGGLVRSPPLGAGYKPPTIGGLPSSISTSGGQRSRDGSVDEGTTKKDFAVVAKTKVATPTMTSAEQPSPNQSNDAGLSVTGKPDTSIATQPNAFPALKTSTRQTETSLISSKPNRPKPETPPKKDFIPSLKARQSSGGNKPREEPEFKNIFGNLKRTQTKNYVAPDELKDNIMRGKAGLAQTGGPKKTERKDEFKESILQKRTSMVAPSASTRITSASSKNQDQSAPEALARRRDLTQSERTQGSRNSEADQQAPKPEALARLQHIRDKPKPTTLEEQDTAPVSPNLVSIPNSTSSGKFTASLAGILQRGPSPIAANLSITPSSGTHENQISASLGEAKGISEGPQLTHATKTRARGPKRRPPAASKQSAPEKLPVPEPDTEPKPSIIESRPSLATTNPKPQSSRNGTSQTEPRPLSNITHNNNNNRKPSETLSPRKPSTNVTSLSDITKVASAVTHGPDQGASPRSATPVKSKPVLSPKGPNTRHPFVSTISDLPEMPSRQLYSKQTQLDLSEPIGEEEKGKSQAQSQDVPLPSVKGAAATWGQSSKPTQSDRARSPVRLPTRKDEEAALEQAGLKQSEPAGVDIEGIIDSRSIDQNPRLNAAQSSRSPPLPGKKPSSIAHRVTSTTLPPPAVTHSKQIPSTPPSQVKTLLADVFDEPPSSKHRININTSAILDACSSKDCSPKIKTLRKQIVEIVENGKLVPVPMHQEHILFDESVYLCTHIFGNQAGQRTTEVYLWFGDAVPALVVEDAQLSARKHAKDNGGKLITLKQGKESTNFFQALGGIVITRRGSGGKANASTGSGGGYILCGRQHVGQITFDEVDYDPHSLCKGFPYIVCTQSGKLYLWKGGGSGADELGCARLIGMDLGSTGEIEELDEGREPDAFWKAFSGNRQDRANGQRASEQYWQLKPSCENYVTRLFNVNFETQRPKSASGFIQGAMQWGRRGSAPASHADTAKTAQIKEIFPFAQSDLVNDGVSVLDAFFEIFVILTIRSLTPAPHQRSTELSAFRAALLFAQEYGILAASSEDRPFVPASSVVICSRNATDRKEKGDLPEGMVHAFRKWDDGPVKDCRILPLTAALEVMGEQR